MRTNNTVRSRNVYALGAIKTGNSYKAITAYGSSNRPVPTGKQSATLNRAIITRVKASQNGNLTRTQRKAAYKQSNAIARQAGYKYKGIRTTSYGPAAKYKAVRPRHRRTSYNRGYHGRFA